MPSASTMNIVAVAGLAGAGLLGAMMLDKARSGHGAKPRKNPTHRPTPKHKHKRSASKGHHAWWTPPRHNPMHCDFSKFPVDIRKISKKQHEQLVQLLSEQPVGWLRAKRESIHTLGQKNVQEMAERVMSEAIARKTGAHRKNPTMTRFEKCVRGVKASAKKRGYPLKSAEGVCAAIGRRKYGAKKFVAMAKAGKAKKHRRAISGTRRISHGRARRAA